MRGWNLPAYCWPWFFDAGKQNPRFRSKMPSSNGSLRRSIRTLHWRREYRGAADVTGAGPSRVRRPYRKKPDWADLQLGHWDTWQPIGAFHIGGRRGYYTVMPDCFAGNVAPVVRAGPDCWNYFCLTKNTLASFSESDVSRRIGVFSGWLTAASLPEWQGGSCWTSERNRCLGTGEGSSLSNLKLSTSGVFVMLL